ncbi:hypothetical protein P389DRAFT_212255 [Cystobasidium minutum MCA 4210]|uniref:uncharacterized protein n=1 Tax=Cystobasidium minutum MCA 4210 TaxID=1397322 RepID=UPI0034CE48B1|eukprot:jgi/Rhomi1/212255/estExt_Genemark1.C_60147
MTNINPADASESTAMPDLSESRPAKKRKLRPPGQAFTPSPGPADDPALHQGRSRAAPHVEGQWSTHIYVEPSASTAMMKTLEDAVGQAKSALQSSHDVAVHSMLAEQSDSKATTSLHLSLSRPIQLWTGQRASFISACRAALTDTRSFDLSFASFDILTNDEKTRSFLVCEVGYGHAQLEALTAVFNKVLEKKHLPKYYPEPRFHISIAWWLHDDDRQLPDRALKSLNDSLGASLRKPVLEVECIRLRIGKDITTIPLPT